MASPLWACAKARAGKEQPPRLRVHGTHRRAAQGSSTARTSPARQMREEGSASQTVKANQFWFWGVIPDPLTAPWVAAIVCSIRDCTVMPALPGSFPREIYIRSRSRRRVVAISRQLLGCITSCILLKSRGSRSVRLYRFSPLTAEERTLPLYRLC